MTFHHHLRLQLRLRISPFYSSANTRAFSCFLPHQNSDQTQKPKSSSAPSTSECDCVPTSDLPPKNLEIDYTSPLANTVPPYTHQILICTGSTKWPSRIEDENEGKNLAAELKNVVRAKARAGADPNTLPRLSILNTSLPSSLLPFRKEEHPQHPEPTSAYILPSFQYVPQIPQTASGAQSLFHAVSVSEARVKSTESSPPKELHPPSPLETYPLSDILILVCSHGARDSRCGTYGPALASEFTRQLLRRPELNLSQDLVSLDELRSPPTKIAGVQEGRAGESPKSSPEVGAASMGFSNESRVFAEEQGEQERRQIVRVAQVSHVGGHKFAGNVIIYFPPNATLLPAAQHPAPAIASHENINTAPVRSPPSLISHPLASHGIWYGRVQPCHVASIISETVLRGLVLEELFRGAVRKGGGGASEAVELDGLLKLRV